MMKSRIIHVLIAEDDPLQSDLISFRLKACGLAVVVAQSGEGAFSMLLAGQSVDVLITDICMPGAFDGWGLAERCRTLYPHLPVIYTTSSRKDAARQVPGSVFIQKPYHPDSVISAIHGIMAMDS